MVYQAYKTLYLDGLSPPTCFVFSDEENTDDLLEKLWKLNDIDVKVNKYNPSTLGESKSAALNRMQSLERWFTRDEQITESFIKFMNEYENYFIPQ